MAGEATAALYGCYRLLIGDRDGLTWLPGDVAGAARSFLAAVIVLPLYAVMLAIQVQDVWGELAPARFVAVMALAYVIVWSAYPLAMHFLAESLDRSHRYPLFLAAHNWAQVYVDGLLALAMLLALVVPGGQLGGLILVGGGLLLVLAYQSYVITVALAVPLVTGAGLVLIKILLTMFIHGFANAASGFGEAVQATT